MTFFNTKPNTITVLFQQSSLLYQFMLVNIKYPILQTVTYTYIHIFFFCVQAGTTMFQILESIEVWSCRHHILQITFYANQRRCCKFHVVLINIVCQERSHACGKNNRFSEMQHDVHRHSQCLGHRHGQFPVVPLRLCYCVSYI